MGFFKQRWKKVVFTLILTVFITYLLNASPHFRLMTAIEFGFVYVATDFIHVEDTFPLGLFALLLLLGWLIGFLILFAIIYVVLFGVLPFLQNKLKKQHKRT